MTIDTAFDFRSDTSLGKDPDSHSPTLRKYHKLLWSKTLPGGAPFDLTDTQPGVYLHHKSDAGEFFLASDAVMATLRLRAWAIVIQLPEHEVEAFNAIGYTIGGMMVFPGNRIGRKQTINQARGFHPRISDRFDLTLECIRRHYLDEANPLGEVLDRYGDFFGLFGDFRGYVDFFLLPDLVTDDHTTVRFFTPFDSFKSSAIPKDVDTYKEYRRRSIEFIQARNRRIEAMSL